MKQLQLLCPATPENFDERGYLLANPDVAAAIESGVCASAREHFDAFHAAGIANGGTTCEDPPGVREGAAGKLYLAYLRDPAGNKICAMHRMPRS